VSDIYKGLPRRIVIGQWTFRIGIVPDDDPRLDGADGITLTGERQVYLAASLSRQTALNTVIHELKHCVNWARDITDDSTEEEFVTQNTYGEVEIWLRHPQVLTWINKQLRELRKELAA
jgi:hypothetical protein